MVITFWGYLTFHVDCIYIIIIQSWVDIDCGIWVNCTTVTIVFQILPIKTSQCFFYLILQVVLPPTWLWQYCSHLIILFTDKPSFEMPSNTSSDEMKSQWLLSLCKRHVEKYAVCSDVACLVEKTDELHQANQHQFQCRFEDCQRTFVFHSRRVRSV